MTTKQLKNEISNHIGDNIIIKHNIGRNKIETYHVSIKEAYNYIFLVTTRDNVIKSFSYSDIISKTIRISYK